MGKAPLKTGSAYLMLVLTFFIWGSLYVAAKLVAGQMSPFLIAGLRCVVASVPLSIMAKEHFGMKIDREDRKYFLLVAVFGYFLTNNLVQLGIRLTGATMSSLINALTPVAVTLLAAVILREKVTPVKYLCLALALAGTYVILQGGSTQSEALGVLACLGSVLSWGFASVLIRRLSVKYPPSLVAAYTTIISLLFHAPVGVAIVFLDPPTITITGVCAVLYMGLIGSGLSQNIWAKCLAVLPASTCSLFYPLQTVFSALLGAVILRETFPPAFFVGLILVSADVALNTWEDRRLRKKETE